MNDVSVDGLPSEIDRVRDEQRRRWQSGDRVLVEDYLRRQPDLNSSTEAVLDLIFGEYVLREEQGEQPQADDYYRRFPALRTRLERLFRLDEVLLKSPLPPPADTSVKAATEDKHATVDYSRLPPTGPGGVGGQVLVAPSPVAFPSRIGKYAVVSALAQGGQAQVFRAVHPTLGRDVVIKLGRVAIPAEGAGRDRLLREGKLLAELEHPNLVRVYDFDVEDNRPYLVMEWVVGRTLEQYRRQEKLTPTRAARLVAQAARALAVAHRRGITHLDVKPQNLLIDDKGQVRVVDFGLARLERHGEPADEDDSLRGTVTYMAPEQARNETDQIGPRSDVYALGGVLYFLLLGQAPHPGRTFLDALEKAAFGGWDAEALRRACVPAGLRTICHRALAREPEQRYSDAEEMAVALERFVAAPVRRRILVGIGLGIVVLTSLVWLTGLLGHQRPLEHVSVPVSQASLEVRIWRGEHYLNVGIAGSARTGDGLRIEAEVPPAVYATLFLRSSDGRVYELSGLQTGAEKGRLTYPEDKRSNAPLEGPVGTEVVLLCARRDRAVTLAEIEPRVTKQAWPNLPADSVLQMTAQEVRLVGKSRPLKAPVRQEDPEGDVHDSLEALGKSLADLEVVQALAFPHLANPEDRGTTPPGSPRRKK